MITMFIQTLLQAPTADHFLFRDGKMNTVALVVFIIWGGTLAYLLLTGRNVSRLEKKADELKSALQQSSGKTEKEKSSK